MYLGVVCITIQAWLLTQLRTSLILRGDLMYSPMYGSLLLPPSAPRQRPLQPLVPSYHPRPWSYHLALGGQFALSKASLDTKGSPYTTRALQRPSRARCELSLPSRPPVPSCGPVSLPFPGWVTVPPPLFSRFDQLTLVWFVFSGPRFKVCHGPFLLGPSPAWAFHGLPKWVIIWLLLFNLGSNVHLFTLVQLALD